MHRARLDRRKHNDNPLAAGSDPDAPEWFEPESVDEDTAGEATPEEVSSPGGRSKEGEIVPMDDLSPDDEGRGGTVAADGEVDIVEASRESDSAGEPEFDGEVPGFTDWREELRERLKRIRARRAQEELANQAAAAEETTAAGPDVADEVAEQTVVEDAESEVVEEVAADAPELEMVEEVADDAPELEAVEDAADDAPELEVVEDAAGDAHADRRPPVTSSPRSSMAARSMSTPRSNWRLPRSRPTKSTSPWTAHPKSRTPTAKRRTR